MPFDTPLDTPFASFFSHPHRAAPRPPGRRPSRPPLSPARWRAVLLAVLGALLAGAVAAQPLTLLTHESFNVSEAVLEAFTERTGIEVEVLPLGDAGTLVNRAVLTRNAPLGDVLFGVDNALFARAAEAELFEPYRPPRLDAVPEELRFDPEERVTPVDVGYVNFNYDKAFLAAAGLEPPGDLDDLVDARFRGLTVVENPATSSPGLAFMLATIARYGEDPDAPGGDWLDFWAALRDNDLLVVDGWSDAYYTAFSRYGGDRPLVLSYASSPAAEVMFADEPLDEAPTANLFCDACVWRQVEAAGVLAGSDRPEAARRFIDFLLSDDFQRDVPGTMFVYPAVADTPLPPEFERHAAVPSAAQVAELPPAAIHAGQQRWLRQWTEVVEQGRAPEAVR